MAFKLLERYYYNPDTLRFERSALDTKARILRFGVYIIAAFAFSFGLSSILYYCFGEITFQKTPKFLNSQGQYLIDAGIAIIIIIAVIIAYYFVARGAKDTELNESPPMKEIMPPGEYILLDLPNKYRGLFQDMLRGFEDFCAIKGYQIKISIDNSFEDKIAFKIILAEDTYITEAQLRQDYQEYTDKIKKREKFNQPEGETNEQFQHRVQLEARINLLERNFGAFEAMLKFQEKILDNNSKMLPNQSPTIIVQVGANGTVATTNQTVNDGTLVVGDGNEISSKVKISNSFNNRNEQILKIKELLNLLEVERRRNQNNTNQLEELVTSLYQIKGSLEKDSNPDPTSMSKWLHSVKSISEKLVLVHHTKEAVEWVLRSFHLIKDVV